MIVSPPSFWHKKEYQKWFAAFVIALFAHWLFVSAFANRSQPIIEPQAMAAVMLEFSEMPQSAMQLEFVTIGLPQQITQDSIAEPSESKPEIAEPPPIIIEEPPIKQDTEIVVKAQPKEKNTSIDDRKIANKTPPKKKENTQVEKRPKQVDLKKKKTEKTKISDVNSQATAQTVSAPPKGNDSKTAAPNDSNAESQTLTQNWQSRVLGHLRRYQSYPNFALENQIEGTTLAHIRIDKSGNVLNIHIHKSSGHSMLDNEVLTIAKRASPLPVPPAHLMRTDNLLLPIPIRFNIKEYRKLKSH